MMSEMYLGLGLFLCMLSATLPSSLASRSSIHREVNDHAKSKSGADHPDYALNLNATNFDAVLNDTPTAFALVQFYAHWCPACRNYKPHYEKVARLFNEPDAVHPGIILITRVDCGLKINTKLCDKFSADHYPMLCWGSPSKFVGGGWEPKQEKSDIRVIVGARTADRLLDWINKEIGSSFGLDDQKFQNELLASNDSDPVQIARAIYDDAEEATSIAFDIIIQHQEFVLHL